MYSQCPDCLTRFRVTADALRAAHGTVRCGRCGSAFDALARLSDTIPRPGRDEAAVSIPAAQSLAPVSPVEAATPSEYHFSADDLEKVFIDSRDWQREFGPSAGESIEIGGEEAEPPVVVVDEATRREDITLEGEHILIEDRTALEQAYEETLGSWPEPAAKDVDSTDRFEVLSEAAEEAGLGEEADLDAEAAHASFTARPVELPGARPAPETPAVAVERAPQSPAADREPVTGEAARESGASVAQDEGELLPLEEQVRSHR
ncbi:MAG TPA: MJ0042-type zinc finger domain-containing protein, partial [Steroidobacteraceae bacterium]|nr:MJ0042-type zinc finger domain-containing protein [Steroidobacteraceae bacterium]